MKNAKLLKFQLAFFFKNPITEDLNKLWLSLTEKISVLDSEPKILPVADAHSIGSMLQLSSKNNEYQMNVLKSRSDFFCDVLKENSDDSIGEYLNNRQEHLLKALSFFTDKTSVYRVGYAVHYFLNVDLPKISKSIFKKEVTSLFEFNMRYNQRSKVKDFHLNNIVQIEQGQYGSEPSTLKGIILLKDINTVQETDYNFNDSLLEKFLKVASELADTNPF